jgi:lysophospholipase L1-like esterase
VRGRITALAAVLLALPVCAFGGQLKLRETGKQGVVVELPGGTARLTLVKAWGRLPRSSRGWILEGEKLPALCAKSGKDWVELTLSSKVLKDTHIEIYRFVLDLSGIKSWNDAEGKRTWLRRGKWQSAAALRSGGNAAQQAWPAVPGCSGAWRKKASAYGLTRVTAWTGFTKERFAGMGKSLLTIDRSAIARSGPGGSVLGLVSNRAVCVSQSGAGKLSISAVARHLKTGAARQIRVRVYLGKGKPDALAARWAAEMDTTPLRVIFVGDSVGAARGSYTGLLANRLRGEYGTEVRNLNASHGGDTSASALREYQQNVLDYNPEIVVIQLCYNDVGRIKPAQVAANLKKMIDPILARKGGRVLVLTPLSYDKKRVDARLKKDGTDMNKVHTEQYIPALTKLVAGYEANPKTKAKVGFANIWIAMAEARKKKGAEHRLLLDGSHPNAEGYKIIADCAWPVLKPLVDSALEELK